MQGKRAVVPQLAAECAAIHQQAAVMHAHVRRRYHKAAAAAAAAGRDGNPELSLYMSMDVLAVAGRLQQLEGTYQQREAQRSTHCLRRSALAA